METANFDSQRSGRDLMIRLRGAASAETAQALRSTILESYREIDSVTVDLGDAANIHTAMVQVFLALSGDRAIRYSGGSPGVRQHMEWCGIALSDSADGGSRSVNHRPAADSAPASSLNAANGASPFGNREMSV